MPFALNILMSLFTTHSKFRGYTLDVVTDANYYIFAMYYLVLSKRPSPAYFRKFSHPHGPYFDPSPLTNLAKFLSQQLQNIQNYTVNKEYFD